MIGDISRDTQPDLPAHRQYRVGLRLRLSIRKAINGRSEQRQTQAQTRA